MPRLSAEMQSCIDTCLACYKTCLGTAMGHCLEVGGDHVKPAHFRLMMTCAEVCRGAAHVMLLGSDHHKHTCAECAEVCQECAEDCDGMEGMEDCVAACRRCAEECRRMAG